MAEKQTSIAVVAPANPLQKETADKVMAIAQASYGERLRLVFHPQCFKSSGHFAGDDAERSSAFLEVANDPAFDAVWFARGGYGSCRLDDALFGKLGGSAHRKTYLGYSDMGFLLARLAREGVGQCVHGPMPADINRENGAAAISRSLAWLVDRDAGSLEPRVRGDTRTFAFNLTVLSAIIGTSAEPDFSGAILMLEDVDEQHYRIDRALYHVTSSTSVRRAAGISMGRFSRIPENDPAFGADEKEIFEYWCRRSGIPFAGAADIGHDAGNRIVPFPIARMFSA